ncbi:hypothetical protein BKA61DRAFT_571479 [Leptodontidium sp. MPI-SDFR-AT-0119]|nr:hypothetical protein BKA61DRAFT_571479 [Leptodontidium sp. MPI-SDFR-AT-0119]
MTAVEHGCGDRLQNLSFSLHSSLGPSATFVKSMKNFRKLKQLELDMELLSIPSDLSTFRGETSTTNPPLRDILPTSVDRISLLVGNVWEQPAGLKNLLAEGDAVKEVQERLSKKIFDVSVESLGIIPSDSTEYTARSNCFLPLNSGLDRGLGSDVIPTVEPPPYDLTPVPSTPSVPESNARISLVGVEDFMPSFMTGWYDRYGID